uniref:Solute carrier family 16 member 6 n=1 Tax=Neogobius melanostomus TaxID=47308 RepID=A0A8C6WFT3_9GOBI
MEPCLGAKVYGAIPEGRWGWVVALAFFMVEVCTYGTLKSLGVFLRDLMQDFGESNSRVSWAISICIFVFSFTAPLATLLGTISSSFTTSIDDMYLHLGVITGLGSVWPSCPLSHLLAQYFSRRRASSCLWLFRRVFASLTVLKEHIGWRYCLMLLGALQACVIGWGLLLCPIRIEPECEQEPALTEKELEAVYNQENEQTHTSISSEDSGVTCMYASLEEKQEKADAELQTKAGVESRPKLLDLSVLRDGVFICYSLFGLLSSVGFFAPHLYVIELSTSRGVEAHIASYMLSVIAVGDIVGRSHHRTHPYQGALQEDSGSVGLCAGPVPGSRGFLAGSGFLALVVCSAVYGYFMGVVGSTHIPLLAEEDVVGLQRMSSAVGVYLCIQSFAGLAGPPLGGLLVDKMENYGAAFALCAAGMGLSAVFLALVGPVMSCRRRKAAREEQGTGTARGWTSWTWTCLRRQPRVEACPGLTVLHTLRVDGSHASLILPNNFCATLALSSQAFSSVTAQLCKQPLQPIALATVILTTISFNSFFVALCQANITMPMSGHPNCLLQCGGAIGGALGVAHLL